jgi:hypothetical protein
MRKLYLDELIDIKEAFKITRIAPAVLRHLCDTRVIPAQKVGDCWLIQVLDLKLYMIDRQMQTVRAQSKEKPLN